VGQIKLEYNILCIDDEIVGLDAFKRSFAEINAKAGIIVNFHDVNAQAGARETYRVKYLERLQSFKATFPIDPRPQLPSRSS
jgi:hypothetical protein